MKKNKKYQAILVNHLLSRERSPPNRRIKVEVKAVPFKKIDTVFYRVRVGVNGRASLAIAVHQIVFSEIALLPLRSLPPKLNHIVAVGAMNGRRAKKS